MRKLLPFLIVLVFSCTKDEIKLGYPRVTTGAVTEITPKGATLHGSFAEARLEEVIDHGFVWGPDSQMSIDSSYYVSLGAAKDLNFSYSLTTLLKAQRSYYVKAYTKTEKYLVYGTTQQFLSLGSGGPIISGFTPAQAFPGDTLTITGSNFISNVANAKVDFRGSFVTTVNVVSISESSIKVLVPLALDGSTYGLSVSLYGNISLAASTFQLLRPAIDTYSPATRYCDSITLNGKYFNKITQVLFEGQSTPFRRNGDIIKFKVGTAIPVSGLVSLLTPTYGISKQLSLSAQKPIINSISPMMVTPSDSIIVKFDYLPACGPILAKVLGQPLPSKVIGPEVHIYADPTHCLDPTFTIHFSIDQLEIASTTVLQTQVPSITLSKLQGTFGDRVTITLQDNFTTNDVRVYFGDVSPVTEYFPDHRVDFIVPDVVDSSFVGNILVEVTTCNLIAFSPSNFILSPPEITDFNPKILTQSDQEVTITGNFFNPVVEENKITFLGRRVKPESITYNSSTEIRFVPSEFFPVLVTNSTETGKLKLVVTGQEVISSQNLQVNNTSPWTRMATFPGEIRQSAISFSVNNKGYIMMGVNGTLYKDVWEYDPATDQWTRKADFPGEARLYPTAFVAGGSAYVGFGSTNVALVDFWKYDPVNDQWTQMNDFPGLGRSNAVSFVVQGNGYVAGGSRFPIPEYVNDLWRYNHLTDTWSPLASPNFPEVYYRRSQFSYQDKGYALLTNIIDGAINQYTYNPSLNQWSSVPSPSQIDEPWFAFSFSNYVQIGPHRLFIDTSTEQLLNFPNEIGMDGVGFVIGSYAYLGFGFLPSSFQFSNALVRFDMTP